MCSVREQERALKGKKKENQNDRLSDEHELNCLIPPKWITKDESFRPSQTSLLKAATKVI